MRAVRRSNGARAGLVFRALTAVAFVLVAVAPGAEAARADTTPTSTSTSTPTPTQSTAPATGSSSLSVTLPGAAGTGSGTGSGSGHRHGPGGSHTPPPGAPSRPSVPSSATATSNTLTLNRGTFRAGQLIVATGHGFAAGEKVLFVLYPGPLIEPSFVADATGTVRASLTLARSTLTGAHEIEAFGWNSGRIAAAHFTVTASSPVGFPGSPWIGWAAACIALLTAIISFVIANGLGWLPTLGLGAATIGLE